MGKFKVKKGMLNYKKLPVEEWKTDHLCIWFQDSFKQAYKVETRRPLGQIKIYINQKKITRLFQLEGRSIDIHPNQLFKEWIEHLLKVKSLNKFRIWMIGKEEMMVDFLDIRAKEKLDKTLGSYEDFQREEEERMRRAEEYFGKNGKGGENADKKV